MLVVKKWEVLSRFKIQDSGFKIKALLDLLLTNRGITTKKQKEEFLHPKLEEVTTESVEIDQKHLQKALKRISLAIEKNEQIVVYGDYDVDGITGTAIIWETLYAVGAKVTPYIPHRVDEGYGLSIKGIENVQSKLPDASLVITVDNGIVANEAVDFANTQGLDVIITDHHVRGEVLPKAYAIVHTTKLCGAGVGYMLSQELIRRFSTPEVKGPNTSGVWSDHLALVALATVADLVPLTGANRTLLTFGLKVLQTTVRPGIVALCQEAQIQQESIGVYEIGHILGPRLNAMGRMESAMDSLRLLCTKDRLKAKVLAEKLGLTNKERQELTFTMAKRAISTFSLSPHKGGHDLSKEKVLKNLLFLAHEEFEEGVIGLIAGKLVEQFYRPAIVLSIGEKVSKASARSIAGFNIIEFIRSHSELLINAGGHPMAAGFTIATDNIGKLQKAMEDMAETRVDGDLLTRVLKIDCELPLDVVSQSVYEQLQTLAPFGMANPEPVFASEVVVKDIRTVGKEKNHLRLVLTPSTVILGSKATPESKVDPGQVLRQAQGKNSEQSRTARMTISAIGFGLGEYSEKIKIGDSVSIAYSPSENIWNGKKEIQLKVRDIKLS